MCFNLFIFVIGVLIQNTLGLSLEVDGEPANPLYNEQQGFEHNETTTQPPIKDDKACQAAFLQKVLEVMATLLREDLPDNVKTAHLLETLTFLLKNTAADNKEVNDKIDDLLITLNKYKPEDLIKSLRFGNENSPVKILVRQPKTDTEKLRLRYELPNLPNVYCSEALLNIAKIAQQAYLSLAENPICNLPGIPNLQGTPNLHGIPDYPNDDIEINPRISEEPLSKQNIWDKHYPKKQRPLNDDVSLDYVPIKNPKQLPKFDILHDLEIESSPSKEYENSILNESGKIPEDIEEFYKSPHDHPHFTNDFPPDYQSIFPKRPKANPYQYHKLHHTNPDNPQENTPLDWDNNESFFPKRPKVNYLKLYNPNLYNQENKYLDNNPLFWDSNEPNNYNLFGKKSISDPLNSYYPDNKPFYLSDKIPLMDKTSQDADNPTNLLFTVPLQKHPLKPDKKPLYPFDYKLNNPVNQDIDLSTDDDDQDDIEMKFKPKLMKSDIASFYKNPKYELEPSNIKNNEASIYKDIPIPNEDTMYGMNLEDKPMHLPYKPFYETIKEIVPDDDNYLVPANPSKLLEDQGLKVIGFIRDAIDVIEGVIPVVKFDAPTLYIIAKIKNILLKDKDIDLDEYKVIVKLYKKLINFVKHLNSYDQIIDRLDLSRVTNSPKLKTKKVVELTYLVKRPQPVVYYPYYYVKYRLPYSRFVVAAEKLLKEKPLRMDPNHYEELLSQSNVIETSPDLKNYKKEDILSLVFKSGSLVNAKLIGENGTLTDHLDALKEITSDLSAEEMLKLNKDAANKIKSFAFDLESVDPDKNNIERNGPVSIDSDGFNDAKTTTKVLKRSHMLDIPKPDTKLDSNIFQPVEETSFDSNKLRNTILQGEHVGIPFSDHLNNVNPWQKRYPLLSSSIPAEQTISPVLYKLFDATRDANLRGQHQPNRAGVNVDDEKRTSNTGKDSEQYIDNFNSGNMEYSVKELESSNKPNNNISTSDTKNLLNRYNDLNTIQNGINIGSSDYNKKTISNAELANLVINEDLGNFFLNPNQENINQGNDGNGVNKNTYTNTHDYITKYLLPQKKIINDDTLITSNNIIKTDKPNSYINKAYNHVLDDNLISEKFASKFRQPSEFKQVLEHSNYQTGIDSPNTSKDEMLENNNEKWVQQISKQSYSNIDSDPQLTQQLPIPQSGNNLHNQEFTPNQMIWTHQEPNKLSFSNRPNFKQIESNNDVTSQQKPTNNTTQWLNKSKVLNKQEANLQKIISELSHQLSEPNQKKYPQTETSTGENIWTSDQKLEYKSNQKPDHAMPSQQYSLQSGSYSDDESLQVRPAQNILSNQKQQQSSQQNLWPSVTNTNGQSENIWTSDQKHEFEYNQKPGQAMSSQQYLQSGSLDDETLQVRPVQNTLSNQKQQQSIQKNLWPSVTNTNGQSENIWASDQKHEFESNQKPDQAMSSQQYSLQSGSYSDDENLQVRPVQNTLSNQKQQQSSQQNLWPSVTNTNGQSENISKQNLWPSVTNTNGQSKNIWNSDQKHEFESNQKPGQAMSSQQYLQSGFLDDESLQVRPVQNTLSNQKQQQSSQQNLWPSVTNTNGQSENIWTSDQKYEFESNQKPDQAVSSQQFLQSGSYSDDESLQVRPVQNTLSKQKQQQPSQQNLWPSVTNTNGQSENIWTSDQKHEFESNQMPDQQAISSQQYLQSGSYSDDESLQVRPVQNTLANQKQQQSSQQNLQNLLPFITNTKSIPNPEESQILINPQSGMQMIPSQQNSGQGTMNHQGIGIYSTSTNPSTYQAIASHQKIYNSYSDQDLIPSLNYKQLSENLSNKIQQLLQSSQNPQTDSDENLNHAPVWQNYQKSQKIWVRPISGQPTKQSAGQSILTQKSIVYTNPSDNQAYQNIFNKQGSYQGYGQTFIPYTSIIYKRPIVKGYYSYPAYTRFTHPLLKNYLG